MEIVEIMVRPEHLKHHSTISMVHNGLAVTATIEYDEPKGPVYLSWPVPGVYGEQDLFRIKLTNRLITKIILQTDGTLRLEY